jgi:putative heme iron utilization protein
MLRPVLAAALLAFCHTSAFGASPLCASPEQAATVQALYATAPVPPTFMAATKLGLPEALVASAISGKQVVGTTGAGFDAVWKSLQEWDDATVVLLKSGFVFEVHGRIPGGAPSTKSQYFNLKQDGAGLGGHFRPDLLGAIYAVELAGAPGTLRGVTFLDAAGESLFGVYVPEGADKKPELVAQFEKTRAVIAALPRVCG